MAKAFRTMAPVYGRECRYAGETVPFAGFQCAGETVPFASFRWAGETVPFADF